jgi:hypothetical protein
MTALPYKLVVVEWVDSSRLANGWMDLAEIPDPYLHKCVTVGFQVAKNKRGIVLVPTIGDTEHRDNSHTYGGMMIPRSAIISRKVLRTPPVAFRGE